MTMRHNNYLSILLGLCCTTLIACGGGGGTKEGDKDAASKEQSDSTTQKNSSALRYNYRIVAEYPHSTESYTQGLELYDGVMWEGTGQHGASHLMRTELTSGKRDIVASLPYNQFGEGITHYKDRIYQLTWLSNLVHIYDHKGTLQRSVPFRNEGWGITTDGERLFVSTGSSDILIVDPETMEYKEVIHVKFNGRILNNINELEWIDGRIWANIYLTNRIVIINPKSGNVEGYLDLNALAQTQYNNLVADVLNGIAYDSSNGHVYVTGKQWNKLFELEIIK